VDLKCGLCMVGSGECGIFITERLHHNVHSCGYQICCCYLLESILVSPIKAGLASAYYAISAQTEIFDI
jgi:hypothetical protein